MFNLQAEYEFLQTKYERLETEYRNLQASFDDWKRIWDTENIIDRLETYTEGYRQRAEALMDAQAKVIKFDALQDMYNQLTAVHCTLQQQYDVTVKTAQSHLERIGELAQANREMFRDYTDSIEREHTWKERAEAAENKVAMMIMALFPDHFINQSGGYDGA